ncbi:glutathione hydrolase 1 proenzyme isoform X2 [Drosophila busckii]|uniref:glutathione hydrolase 1 proenzyme isoform X2 n=1 Tax=Drosophila busckii TaxID=30019 RepID=UPI00083F314C|nr:glutathione hydrolase 1 proenzyme isoform X2 [Drosophila busckii]
MVHHSNEDAMNKIPLKSHSGLDDEERNGGELMQDTNAAEEARREQMRANVLVWMKKLTIGLICFIGIALISYVIISLCFSDEPNDDDSSSSDLTTATPADTIMAGPAVAASTAATTAAPTTTYPKLEYLGTDFESKLGVYEEAAVCTDGVAICSQIATDILQRNGSAVDATIAMMLCNGLTTPQSMGIGGGLLMNIYERATQQGHQIDAHPNAPYVDAMEYEANPNATLAGPMSIAVPGEVRGYQLAHMKFGKLPWRELVTPSLEICQTGYEVSRHLARSLKRLWHKIKHQPQFHSFAPAETGEPLEAGSLAKPSPALCDSYRLLAENGAMDFYNGTLAKLIIEDLNELGSKMSEDDLDAYQAEVRLSITMPLGSDTVYAVPPVSSGSVVSYVLSVLKGYNFTREDFGSDEQLALTIHRISEALKLGFARRGELGDQRFVDVRELVSQLNNPEYGNQQRLLINDSHVLDGPEAYGAHFSAEDDRFGTSGLTVLAPNGDAVAVSSSINFYFGSLLVGPRTGIVFNNALNDFSRKSRNDELPPSPSNFLEPYKRPMSSQSPMLITDAEGNVRLAIAASGSGKIIPAVVEVIARVLWFGEDIKTAVDAPRFYHQLKPDTLDYEPKMWNERVKQLLEQRGHTLKEIPKMEPTTTVCAIVRNSTAIYANSDYRKQGFVAGY